MNEVRETSALCSKAALLGPGESVLPKLHSDIIAAREWSVVPLALQDRNDNSGRTHSAPT